MMMTTNFESGLKAPENEKLSVGKPSDSPIPPNAETSSKTENVTRIVCEKTEDWGGRNREYAPSRKMLNHGALSLSMSLVRSIMQMKKMPHTSHHISNES